MTAPEHDTGAESIDAGGLNRRTVLKSAGAATVTGAFFTAGASAHPNEIEGEPLEGKPVFCGCSQVCACLEGSAYIVVATETADGYRKRTPHVKKTGNFCHEVSGDDKILAIEIGGKHYCNPNTCAKKARSATGYECDTKVADTSQCGHPPCEHPGRDNGGGNGRGRSGESGQGDGNGGGNRGGRGNGKGRGNGGGSGRGNGKGQGNGGGNGNGGGSGGGNGNGRGNGNGGGSGGGNGNGRGNGKGRGNN